ncbi:MAG: hypothetical protein KAG93_03500 [Desulfuromusa sp.]|nr:hypothetical protein [Desulfuromusa sp.]
MFIQHKQLKNLNIPAGKISHLHSSSSSLQLSFAEYSPQLCWAYLLQISGGDKTLVVVAFYLAESQCSIFFVPQYGEVPDEDAEKVYEEGYSFIESMGFDLTETDYHLLSEKKKKSYWAVLPIRQSPAEKTAKVAVPAEKAAKVPVLSEKTEPGLEKLCSRSLESLGNLFASM